MLCYLAEAIDHAAGRSPRIDLLAHALSDGMAVYRPATAWTGGPSAPAPVEWTNRNTLLAANVLVADLSTNVPSIGVPQEVLLASEHGIPALVLRRTDQPPSVQLRALPGVHTIHWDKSEPGWVARQARDHAAAHHRRDRPPTPDGRIRVILDGPPPVRAYDDDAGWDLIASEDTAVHTGVCVDIPTTVTGIQLPPGTWALVTGRSSTLRRRGLHVPVSVIDAGWRGPMYVGAWNMHGQGSTVHVAKGERIGQLIVLPSWAPGLLPVDRLDPHERGLNGFGSSGT